VLLFGSTAAIATPRPFNIDAQEAPRSLLEFGRQSAVQILFASENVKGITTNAVHGTYEPIDALRLLLKGTPLVVSEKPNGVLIVEPKTRAKGASKSAPLPGSAAIATDDSSKHFEIKSKPLGNALMEFEVQSGLTVVAPTTLTAGKMASTVRGDLTPTDALSRLLKGSGLTFARSSEGTIAIQAISANGPVERQSKLEEIVVIGVAEGFAATRSATPLREIPQSVSVISRDTLDQQNATDLPSALAQSTGITLVQNRSEQTFIYSRGFQVDSIHIDGGAPIEVSGGSIDVTSRDLAEFESIEVLRGSDGLFGGMGNPGASVSLNRKQPTATPQAKFEASVGSWNQYRLVGDVSGPLNSSGTIGGRLVVAGTDMDYFYDIANQRKRMVYGILRYDLSPSTTLELGGSYDRARGINASSGLPFYDTGADPHLPRSLALTAPWARNDTSFTEAFAKLDHHFNDNWRLKVNATLLNQDMREFTEASAFGPINSATGLLPGPLSATEDPLTNKQSMLDATLTGSFDWLGQKQEVMIGADYQHQITRSNLLEPNSSGPAIDPFAFDPQLYPAPDSSQLQGGLGLNILQKTIQWGVYGAVRFRPIENLSLLAGGRLSDYRSNRNLDITYAGQPLQNSTSGYNDSGKFTPYAGITYDLSSHYTLYASYADIYHTNNGVLTKDFKQLPASDGVNMETGIKGSWYSNTLNASLALFKIDQSGLAISDPTVPPSPTCCYITQSQKSKGFETEVTGTLLPNWQVTAGYTYDDYRNASAYYVAELPKSIFKLWTNYRLPIDDGRWSMGGGVRAESANHVTQCVAFAVNGCAGFVPFHQGAYLVADLRAAYAFNKHWSASLNLNNIFDRSYYQALSVLQLGNWYGAPRSFMFKVEGKL